MDGSRGKRALPRCAPGISALLVSLSLLPAGCGKEPLPRGAGAAAPGRTSFESYCSACHHPQGLGMKDGAPPLVASPWLRGPEARLIRILLHGVGGPLKLGGKDYNLEMPGFGQILTDGEIAAVLSYVRGSFGGIREPVAAEAVGRVRAATRDREGYWTFAELEEVR